MKLVKSLLLGTVAGIAAVAGAQAADLPSKKAAPVEYVRVCSTYGAGFFYIPGTETCLRVGGRVRAEFGYVEPDDREDDAIGFRESPAPPAFPSPSPSRCRWTAARRSRRGSSCRPRPGRSAPC